MKITYTNDMKKIKSEFIISFLSAMNKNLDKWQEKQSEYRKKLYSSSALVLYLLPGLLLFIVYFLPGFFLGIFFDFTKQTYLISLIILCVFYIVAIIVHIVWVNKDYQKDIKRSFFEDIIKSFGGDIHYINEIANCALINENCTYNITCSEFNNTKLYRQYANADCAYYDDRFYGAYKDILFKINELEFKFIYKSQNGEKEKRLFKGLALMFELNKLVKNRVIIVSKNSFYKPPKNYQKVEVEYNKFSEKYDVYVDTNSSDPSAGQIEARYLLNTAFLDRFMQIQTSFKVNKMQCSIYGNDLLIMLSTRKDLFEMNHLLSRIDDVNQYEHLFNEFASIFSFIDVLNLSSKTKL